MIGEGTERDLVGEGKEAGVGDLEKGALKALKKNREGWERIVESVDRERKEGEAKGIDMGEAEQEMLMKLQF